MGVSSVTQQLTPSFVVLMIVAAATLAVTAVVLAAAAVQIHVIALPPVTQTVTQGAFAIPKTSTCANKVIRQSRHGLSGPCFYIRPNKSPSIKGVTRHTGIERTQSYATDQIKELLPRVGRIDSFI